MSKYINTGDYCEIVSDKFVNEGVKRGHIVYVAGHKALPIAENDPYTQRIKFFVNLVNFTGVVMTDKLFLMDADSLLKVSEDRQEWLKEAQKEYARSN